MNEEALNWMNEHRKENKEMYEAIARAESDNMKSYYIYKTPPELVEYQPQTDVGQRTGLVGFGLWVGDGVKEKELLGMSEQPSIKSSDPDFHENTNCERVSDEFVEAVRDYVVDGIDYSDYEPLEEVEKVLLDSIAISIREENLSDEMDKFVRWCINKGKS
jgi:hypothetical protein